MDHGNSKAIWLSGTFLLSWNTNIHSKVNIMPYIWVVLCHLPSPLLNLCNNTVILVGKDYWPVFFFFLNIKSQIQRYGGI